MSSAEAPTAMAVYTPPWWSMRQYTVDSRSPRRTGNTTKLSFLTYWGPQKFLWPQQSLRFTITLLRNAPGPLDGMTSAVTMDHPLPLPEFCETRWNMKWMENTEVPSLQLAHRVHTCMCPQGHAETHILPQAPEHAPPLYRDRPTMSMNSHAHPFVHTHTHKNMDNEL